MSNKKNRSKSPIELRNMSEFLKGQASKIFTDISDNDTTAVVLKNGKPKVVIISYEKYDRLFKNGFDLNEH